MVHVKKQLKLWYMLNYRSLFLWYMSITIKGVFFLRAKIVLKELLLIEIRYFKYYFINREYKMLDIITPTFNKRKNGALKDKLIPILVLDG